MIKAAQLKATRLLKRFIHLTNFKARAGKGSNVIRVALSLAHFRDTRVRILDTRNGLKAISPCLTARPGLALVR